MAFLKFIVRLESFNLKIEAAKCEAIFIQNYNFSHRESPQQGVCVCVCALVLVIPRGAHSDTNNMCLVDTQSSSSSSYFHQKSSSSPHLIVNDNIPDKMGVILKGKMVKWRRVG